MRTTISIAGELLNAARRRASEKGVPLGRVIEAGLRLELARDHSTVAPPDIPVFRAGTGPRPGVDLDSSRALYEVLDDIQLDQH